MRIIHYDNILRIQIWNFTLLLIALTKTALPIAPAACVVEIGVALIPLIGVVGPMVEGPIAIICTDPEPLVVGGRMVIGMTFPGFARVVDSPLTATEGNTLPALLGLMIILETDVGPDGIGLGVTF